jgi:hypothetical protein
VGGRGAPHARPGQLDGRRTSTDPGFSEIGPLVIREENERKVLRRLAALAVEDNVHRGTLQDFSVEEFDSNK